jgi:predicted site-specific integrase-resolvase
VTKLLTPKETAAQLRVSISTLRGWRKQGKGPPVIELGPGSFRYPEELLKEYIQSKIGQIESG